MKPHDALRTAILSVALYLLAVPWASAATDNATLTVGGRQVVPYQLLPPCGTNIRGFNTGTFSTGSYSPTGLTGGKTVITLYDSGTCTYTSSTLTVNGFALDPGHLWATSVTCNGVTKQTSTASFTYTSGSATWTWGSTFGFNALVGTNISCSITHS
jgi:hypothetical protein